MRYAIFTDIHANIEALEAVLAKIDEIAEEKSIDQIWFLGDLVGYGPNPNECIKTLRERTDVIIAGNHDWAAVGKIDLEDFSTAARISAEWTAEQLTEEHRTFLVNLPERIEIDECTLVHGSPYGPLWEYLTSEVLAERSFQYFTSRFCFVGHTHVPIIFQQPDSIANAPTLPLMELPKNGLSQNGESSDEEQSGNEAELVLIQPNLLPTKVAAHAESAYADPETGLPATEEEANAVIEAHQQDAEQTSQNNTLDDENGSCKDDESSEATLSDNEEDVSVKDDAVSEEVVVETDVVTPEEVILSAEDRLNSEIEELLTLLGLSESMIQVTNEMLLPPEGQWVAPEGYRAIVNPGGVGQPRDGDPRAAFMIYDTESGFEFYRVPYAIEVTQEKIIQAGLPPYLAARLSVGR
jgi:diadenosine tetraphosphatase ApaH/serine/threonine PP2A family protein phosphatase